MANFEPYDFLSTITADYNVDIALEAQGTITETSMKNQTIHLGDDGSEERVSHSSTSIFYVDFNWNVLSESDAGTVFDFYNDPSKANGRARSFKWTHKDQSSTLHVYVVRFDCTLQRVGQHRSRYGIQGVRFKILGRIAD